MEPRISDRVAFCSWSTQPGNPRELVHAAAKVGVSRVQLQLDPVTESLSWRGWEGLFDDAGLTIVSGMFSPLGEDYQTPETIRETGGVTVDGLWPENLDRFRRAAEAAAGIGLERVTMHAGFLPERNSRSFDVLRDRVAELARILHELAGAELLLETGQETADELSDFLESLSASAVGVNFDPANMLLYDKGDPIAALQKLSRHIGQVHIKDGRRPAMAGTWGTETPFGEGEVDWGSFFAQLTADGYDGDLVVERESGERRHGDIRSAAIAVSEAISYQSTNRGGMK